MPSNNKDKTLLPEDLRNGEVSERLQGYLKTGIKYAIFAILGIAAFSITSFLGAPFVVTALVNAWFAGSVIYLSGLAYGIVNDIIACRKNLPYFVLGHQPWQRAIIKSNDPDANAVAWGIVATWGLALLAAVIFTAATFIMGLAGLSFAAFTLPIIGLCLPLAIGAAHLFAKLYVKKNVPELTTAEKNERIDNLYLDGYQKARLKYWLKDTNDFRDWLSNGARNGFGYVIMPLLGVFGLISIITCSALSHVLPAVFFGAALSVFPPLGFAVLLAVGIIASCLYLYARRNTIVDSNPYTLDYPSDEPKATIAADNVALSNRPQSTHVRLAETFPVSEQKNAPSTEGNVAAIISSDEQRPLLDASDSDEEQLTAETTAVAGPRI